MQTKKPDVFDRIMHLPGIRISEPFYLKHKEILLYLFFGLISFLISVGTYALFTEVLHVNVLIANIIAWILSVSFAYISSRIWVFENTATGGKAVIAEIGKFVSGRLGTLAIEELILYIFITRMGLNSMAVKLAATIIVIILNYVISKIWVFRAKESNGTDLKKP